MSRIALLGASGMFGRDAVPIFEATGYEVIGADLPEVDIVSASSLTAFLDASAPEAVINAAAYTDVDGAEENREMALRINAFGAHQVAEACRDREILLVHLSTDYVFKGDRPEGYFPDDATGPAINAYGESKLAGEQAIQGLLPEVDHLICRTQWLYGEHGKNFVDTIGALAATRPQIRVVDDQWGVPTHTGELARQILACVASGRRGFAHTVGGGGPMTWYAFAKEIVALRGLPCEVVPCASEEFPRPAARPRYAWLRDGTAGGDPLAATHWKESLAGYLGRTPP